LTDYILIYTSHVIVLNSLVAIHKSLVSRSKTRQQQQQQQQLLEQKAATALATPAAEDKPGGDSEQEFPVFSCQISVVDRRLVVNPDSKVKKAKPD
jgi:hypothetical protein